METVKKVFSSIFLVIVLFTNSVFAGNEEGKVLASDKFAYSLHSIKNSLKIHFTFDNESGQEVKINIFDQQGQAVKTDLLKSKNSMVDYDLEESGKGIYQIEVKAGEFKSTQTFAVGMEVEANPFYAVLEDLEDKNLNIKYENGVKGVYIRLVDANETIVYSEKTNDEANYSRRFDLSDLKKGKYLLQVFYEDQMVEKTYEIE